MKTLKAIVEVEITEDKKEGASVMKFDCEDSRIIQKLVSALINESSIMEFETNFITVEVPGEFKKSNP